jgi:hypothetical protein
MEILIEAEILTKIKERDRNRETGKDKLVQES